MARGLIKMFTNKLTPRRKKNKYNQVDTTKQDYTSETHTNISNAVSNKHKGYN